MWPFTRKKKYTLTPTQELLLALLRAQLWLKPVDDIVLPSTMEQWDDLLNLAYKQTVVCFIAAACLRHKDVSSIPQGIFEELEAVIEENKKIHEYHNEVLVELITKFEEQGLHPVLLKGQGIAQMYPEPELRQCGDIDLYFQPEEFENAKKFMLSVEDKGFVRPKEMYKHFDSQYRGMEIEIHRHTCLIYNPFSNKHFQQWTLECMSKTDDVVILGKCVKIPEIKYNIISVFLHFKNHIENGDSSIRQVCDIVMFISKNDNLCKSVLFNQLLHDYSVEKIWKSFRCEASFFLSNYDTQEREHEFGILYFVFNKCFLSSHETLQISRESSMVSSYILRALQKKKNKHLRLINKAIALYPYEGKQVIWRFFKDEKFTFYRLFCKCIDNTQK